MKIDETILCGFSSIFNRVIRLDKGIKRMGIIASWGNDGCLGCTQDEFNALAEFVVFNEGIKRPFYGILDSLLKGRADKLFLNLRDVPLEKIHQLSYEEAFVFLQTIKPYVRKILDSYNCSSFVYNGILDAVNNNDCNKFVETLNKDDHSKFMKIMCVMNFILYGKGKPEKCNSRNNYWLYNHNLQDYFYDYNESEEISFIETTIQKYLGIRKKTVRTRKYPYTCNKFLFNENLLQQINDITYIAEGRYYNYWIDKFDKENISGTDLLGYINQKIQKHHQIEDCVSFLCNSILFKKVREEIEGIYAHFNVPYSQEKMQWMEEYRYYSSELSCFGDYILLHSYYMVQIMGLVKGVLCEDEYRALEWMLGRSKYTGLIMSTEKQSAISQGIDIEYLFDNDKQHSSWHLTIQTSKVKVANDETFIQKCYTCLEQLYEVLRTKQYIDLNTKKELFIYRFSGIGTPYPLTANKIQWKGKNVLLGHLIRCLISDERNDPKNLGLSTAFFESKSGNNMNLATACHVDAEDYDKRKNYLDRNFVEAVEILRECGFVNAEKTTKRR